MLTEDREALIWCVCEHKNGTWMIGNTRACNDCNQEVRRLRAEPPPARQMNLGRLILETARGNVKERTLSREETQQLRESMARYFSDLRWSRSESEDELSQGKTDTTK